MASDSQRQKGALKVRKKVWRIKTVMLESTLCHSKEQRAERFQSAILMIVIVSYIFLSVQILITSVSNSQIDIDL